MKRTELYSGLSDGTVKWLRGILKLYEFDTGEQEILRRCGELKDQADIALVEINKDGAYFQNRFGEPRQHPAIRVHQQCIDLQARLLKQLNIKTEDSDEKIK